MQAIERIKKAISKDGTVGDWMQACDPSALREILAHIDALEAENKRLRTESEERLQNAVALVAENEQFRKDAERKPMHEGEIQAAWLGHGIEEPMPYTFELGIRSAERFNGIKGTS